MTYGDVPENTFGNLFVSSRSIDWVATFSNPSRALEEIANSLSKTNLEFLDRITAGLVARYPEFRTDTNENLALISQIYASINWKSKTKFKSSKALEYSDINQSEVDDILANSPNLIVLYMISNLSLNNIISKE